METPNKHELEKAILDNDITGFRDELIKKLTNRLRDIPGAELWTIFQKAAGNAGINWSDTSEPVYDDGVDYSSKTYRIQNLITDKFVNEIVAFIKKRRNYIRLDFNEKIRIRVMNEETPDLFPAITDNVSSGGILFRSKNIYNVGDKLELIIPAKDGFEDVMLSVVVVRAEKIEGDLFEIGASVTALKEPEDLHHKTRSWVHTVVKSEYIH